MTKEELIDWLCRLRSDLNTGVLLTPWKNEYTEALNFVIHQEIKGVAKCRLNSLYGTMVTKGIYYHPDEVKEFYKSMESEE